MFVDIKRTINVYFLIENLNAVTRKTDHALNIVLARIMRINENDHIATLRLADGDYGVTYEGNFDAIKKFIDKYMVTNKECGFHRA